MTKKIKNLFLITFACYFATACSSFSPARAKTSYKKNKTRSFLTPVRNRQVKSWIKYFTKRDRARFQRFLKNGAKYKPYIESILSKYRLPKELYFVGLIESGYYLHAKSHASAVGPWQFIRGTGRRFGLKVNRSLDDRRNIIKATHAAAKYLKKLHRMFGSWELALSAYNMGEYGLKRRIRRARTKNFYRLAARRYLPRETRNYVPKVLAAIHVYKNARRYGFSTKAPRYHAYKNIEKVRIKGGISLRSVAKHTDTSYRKLRKLNPEYKRAHLPHSRRYYQLLVPGSRLKRFKRLARVDRRHFKSLNPSKSYYRVRRGDNLSKIASRFGLTIKALKRLNKLSSSKILVNQKIKLTQAARKKYHVVRRGDNLSRIANRYGLRLAKLKRLNRISRSKIYPGQRLIVEI